MICSQSSGTDNKSQAGGKEEESSSLMQLFTQSVAIAPWPTHGAEQNGGLFISSSDEDVNPKEEVKAPAIVETKAPCQLRRSHSRRRASLTQINAHREEDPREIMERLQPIPVVKNEPQKSVDDASAKGKSRSSWFSFFAISRRSNSLASSPTASSPVAPKGILKVPKPIPFDDGSSVSSHEITTSQSPSLAASKTQIRLRFDNEVRICETFHKEDYCRQSVEYVARQLTPAVALAIKKELNEMKQEMEVHEEARHLTQFYVIK